MGENIDEPACHEAGFYCQVCGYVPSPAMRRPVTNKYATDEEMLEYRPMWKEEMRRAEERRRYEVVRLLGNDEASLVRSA